MKRTLILLFILMFALALPVFAEEISAPRVIDQAGLLSSSDEELLEDEVASLKEKYNFDIVILTVRSTGEKSVTAYADDYYDYNGYGCGDGRDGMLLLISMEERDWCVSTSGRGNEVFGSDFLDYLEGSAVIDRLSDADYYGAFDRFLGISGSYLESDVSGNPVKIRRDTGDTVILCVIAVIASFVVSLIILGVMKSRMNTVIKRSDAADYVRRDSFNMRRSADYYLYSTETKIRIQRSQTSVSGTHISSSGRSHGGRHGKF